MDLFKLVGEIAINNENATKNIKEIMRLSEDARDKISKGFGNIGKAAVTMGKLIGGALIGSGAIGGALVSLTDNTMEYRTAMGKLDAAFLTSGHSAEVAHATYSDLVSVLGDTDVAVEASNHLAKLATNQQDLSTWTNICTGVFATFGDSLPIEGLTEAANETAKVGQVTGPLADALNWAGVSEDAFNEKLAACTSEQERQRLIMETLNGIYDEASQKYQEINADVIEANKAQENYTEAMAEFGKKAQPVVNAVKKGLGQLLLAVSALVANADFSAIEASIESAFSWMIDTVVPAVSGFVNFLFDNEEAVLAVIAAVGAGFLAWNVVTIIQGVISAIQAWKLATEGMTLAQQLLNLVMNANPIGIIITLISALVAAFLVLWNNCEGFRTFFLEMWESIKTTVSNAVSSIVDWVVNMATAISAKWEEIKTAIAEKIESTVATVTTKFNEIKQTIESKINDARSKVREVFDNIRNDIEEKITAAKDKVKSVIDAIKGFFDFEFKWPHIPLPHFSIQPAGWKVDDLLEGKIPTLGIEWYAKGGILNSPTIFGMNGNNAMVGGEAGAEAVAPIDVLQGYVASAVASQNMMLVEALERIHAAILSMDENMGGHLKDALDDTSLKVNNREFGRLVRGVT